MTSILAGLRSDPLVLGANVFGWTADRDRSFEILDRYVDAGFRAIDTADSYSIWVPGNSGGESETLIGEWLTSRGARDKVTIITKVGSEVGPGKKGLSAAYITQAVEASLRRLRTDVIDVYLSHYPDPSVPQEETLGAYAKLIEAGKVREIGCSNHSPEQLRGALDLAETTGLPRYSVLQPEYNLYDREAFETEHRDTVIAEGIDVIPYYSLAAGFLTGKYRSEADQGKSPRGGRMRRYLNPRGMAILDALDRVAKARDATPAEVAIAWVAAQPGITAPIASATSVKQLESLMRGARLKLSNDDLSRLERASDY